MAAIPLVAVEAATGTNGSDGLAVFTFTADIDPNHLLAVDRMPQGDTIDYTVTGARQITFIAPNIPVAGARIWLWNGVTAATSTGTGLPGWDTVAEVVSDAAIELGLVPTPVADPFASADQNILQLIALLKSGGRKLARSRAWAHLRREYTFSTVNGTATYLLPSDFRSMVDQTNWNRTTRYPGDMISPQMWQYLKAIGSTATLFGKFDIQGGQLSFIPTPGSVATIAFEYQSTYWIRATSSSSPTSDTPTVASDVVCFDNLLAVSMLKLAWLKAKHMESSAAQDEYDIVFSTAAAADGSPAPVLSFGGPPDSGIIDWSNVSDTGYGI